MRVGVLEEPERTDASKGGRFLRAGGCEGRQTNPEKVWAKNGGGNRKAEAVTHKNKGLVRVAFGKVELLKELFFTVTPAITDRKEGPFFILAESFILVTSLT